ncbi:MAG TPA: hypothetical protein VLD18_00440 [Verrucomicrobiae bacterium]|nr:hypothetical protein [Verrucomicrobiae bacterium]
MITKHIPKLLSTLLMSATLVIASGCGGGTPESTVDKAAASQLEAKVAEGDASAAMKLGEMYAADVGNKESQIEAAKWFHIAGRMGHAEASVGLNAITGGLPFEDQAEAERRVELFKFPAKP